MTWKSMLHEYYQKVIVEPKYCVTQDERSGEFIGVVTIFGQRFQSIGSFTSRKVAEEMAAKVAMEYFNRFSSKSCIGSDVNEEAGECQVNAHSVIATTVKGDSESLASMKELIQPQLPELTGNASQRLTR